MYVFYLGILVIVQNHPGYVLNFKLAKMRAAKEGIHIKMLVIEDEAQLSKNEMKSRGLLGALYVYKIAGAMAKEGKDLYEIFSTCSKLATENITSIGICTGISVHCPNDLKCREMEIGKK